MQLKKKKKKEGGKKTSDISWHIKRNSVSLLTFLQESITLDATFWKPETGRGFFLWTFQRRPDLTFANQDGRSCILMKIQLTKGGRVRRQFARHLY